jgi:myo-inositol-1(or 4)-monophosphatase
MTSSYLTVCEKAARSAGEILRNMLGTINVRHKKNQFDLVTDADVAAQTAIERILFEAFPDHGFLGEEGNLTQSGGSGDSQYRWIVDPLDGTTNYVHGFPLFCTSIALVCHDEPICGAIYNPMTDEFYSAEKGNGAFLNGKQIYVSSRQTLEESLVSISLPTEVNDDDSDLQMLLRSITVCQAIRRTGSTALNLAFIAAGRLDAGWAFKCHAWDIAAGILLVQEAGGIVTQPNGQPIAFTDPSPVCAVCNAALHSEILQLLNYHR